MSVYLQERNSKHLAFVWYSTEYRSKTICQALHFLFIYSIPIF